MPEITSVTSIRDKLKAFDSRMDGAIDAANTLERVKEQAEKLLSHIEQIEKKSIGSDGQINQSLENARVAGQQNQRTRAECEVLRNQLDAAMQLQDKALQDAEERLKTFNQTTLTAQATSLNRLAASTKAHAEAAEKASANVTQTAAEIENTLIALEGDLTGVVQVKLDEAKDLLVAEVQRVENQFTLEQRTHNELIDRKAERYQRLLREEMTTFKAELNRQLEQYEEGIGRRLNEFLSQQNTLVQNLAQQIDSFNRASQAQSVEIDQMTRSVQAQSAESRIINDKISEMVASIKANQEAEEKIATALGVQDQSFGTLQTQSQDTAKELAQILDKLKQVPMIGSRFR